MIINPAYQTEYDIGDVYFNDNKTRIYEINEFKYPSVTSIIGKTKPKSKEDGLKKWRLEVGEKEADRIVKESLTRGNDLHEGIEQYLTNGEFPSFSVPIAKYMFKSMKHLLDDIEPYMLESTLYSHKLKIAGSVDCVGLWRGVPAIIDFKNSRKTKRASWITDYFIQTTLYSLMLHEMTGKQHKKLVVLIGNLDNLNKASCFEVHIKDYYKQAIERVMNYYKLPVSER